MPRLKTASSQFGLIGGICRATSDCIRVDEPPATSATARWKGNLYLLAEPVVEGGRGYPAAQQLLAEISRHYYACTSPSVTTCLGRAIREANRSLFQRNMQVSGHEKVTIGVTCAVVRGGEVFVAQVLPGQAYIVHRGRIQAFPLNPSWDPEAATLPTMVRLLALGWSEDVSPEFFHSPLDSGDVLCLCSSNIGRFLSHEEAEQVLLYQEPGDVVEQLYRRVHGQGFGEAHAVVVEIQPAASREGAPFFSRAGLQERARSVGLALASWGSFLSGEARRLFQRPARSAEPYVRPRQPEPPVRQRAEPEIPLLERPQPPTPWWQSIRQTLHHLLHPQDRYPRLERPRLRVGVSRSERRQGRRLAGRFLSPILVIGAVLVLVLLIFLFVNASRQQREEAIAKAVQSAREEIDAAMALRDPAEANRQLDITEQRLQETIATLGPSSRISLTLSQLREARDRLNNVIRFETLEPLVDLSTLTQTLSSGQVVPFCPAGCLLRNVVLISDTLYLLEGQTGSVFEYDLTRGTCSLILGNGIAVGGQRAGPILAIARVPRVRDGEARPGGVWLAAIDSDQWLYLRRQGRWDEPVRLAGESETPWKDRGVDLEGFNGYLYVLKGEYGQILRYDGAFGWAIWRWVTDSAQAKIESTVDIVIDGDIYALLGDQKGTVQVLRAGAYKRTITYQVYPATMLPGQVLTDLENLDSPYIYVLDRHQDRLIQLYKERQPALVRQLRGPADTDLSNLQAAAVRGERLFYLAAGSRLFRGTLSAPAAPSSPTVAPAP